MKKKNLIIIACLLTILAFAGCAGKSAENLVPKDDEIVLPEGSSVPSAAEVVETIINKEDIITIPQQEIELQTTPEEEEQPMTDVTVYYVKGTFDQFQTEVISVEEVTPENLIRALSLHNIVPVDTNIMKFELVEDEEGKQGVSLDLSGNFKAYLDTMSDEAKKAIISSITDTFIEAYDAKFVELMDMKVTWSDLPTDSLEDSIEETE